MCIISRRRISSFLSVPLKDLKRPFTINPNLNPSQATSINGENQLSTFASCSDALKNCSKKGLASLAKQLHSHLLKLGFHGALSVQNQILHAYIKCGHCYSARQLLDEMPVRNIVSWNTVICGSTHEGFVYFRRMLVERVNPDCLTLNGLIRSSLELNELVLGEQLHGLVVKWGFDCNGFVGCALVNLYGTFGLIDDARFVFDQIKCRDLVLWNVMVSCYGVNSLTEEAVRVFRLMCKSGFLGDEFTFSSLLSSCATPGYRKLGKQIHDIVIKLSFDSDLHVASAIVDMYAKNSEMGDARNVFDGILIKNVVSWTTMIVGYGQNGDADESMKLLVQMLRNGLYPNDLTIASLISSCGDPPFFNEALEVHCYATKTGFETECSVISALIVSYSKCGSLDSALKCFESVQEPNMIILTSILGAYGLHGRAKESIKIFEMMLSNGFRPDEIAFLAVISSCSHGGFITKGLHYFKMMINDYQIVPRHEHYTCLIDLIARSGLIDEAFTILNSLPIGSESTDALGALFGACKIHGHVKIAEWIAEKLFQLEPKRAVNYSLMSSIYGFIGHWYNAAMTQEIVSYSCHQKHPGCSWIEQ